MMHDSGSWSMGMEMGAGHWGFGILFWLIVLLVVAGLVKYLFVNKSR